MDYAKLYTNPNRRLFSAGIAPLVVDDIFDADTPVAVPSTEAEKLLLPKTCM